MISQTITTLIQKLKPRQREILSGRFGLEHEEVYTLAGLGERYDITRERVRQIESEALRLVREDLRGNESLRTTILQPIYDHLLSHGGIRRDDVLIEELRDLFHDKNLHHWHLRFLSGVIGEPSYYASDDDFHFFWYVDKDVVRNAQKFIATLQKLVTDKKEDLILRKKFEDYFSRALQQHDLPHAHGMNYLSVSRAFQTNPFGDIGLAHWEEINPRTMRDKAYLVLKKEGHPMHFTDVAKAINGVGFRDDREALAQTVHNELIKDNRVVLVGRGIYGLREHGYMEGTCRDVLRAVLKEHGPLDVDSIVAKVGAQRFLKHNTILLNLQNKKFFKRLDKGRYHLA